MKKIPFLSANIFFILCSVIAIAQSGEMRDNIAPSKNVSYQNSQWLHYYNRALITERFSVSLDGGIRRNDIFEHWEEYILRAGAQYRIHNNINVGAGLAYDFVFDNPYPELRFHQEVNTRNKEVLKSTITNRVRFEERLISTVVKNNNMIKHSKLSYRARYKFGVMYPIFKTQMLDDTYFILLEDEVFFNLGGTTSYAFDRNRLTGGLGYRYNERFTGVINYTFQYTRNTAYDYLHSDILWISLCHTFDLTGQKRQIPTLDREE